jgi:hypothetical protein
MYIYVYIYIRAHFMQFIDGIGPNLTVLMGVYAWRFLRNFRTKKISPFPFLSIPFCQWVATLVANHSRCVYEIAEAVHSKAWIWVEVKALQNWIQSKFTLEKLYVWPLLFCICSAWQNWRTRSILYILQRDAGAWPEVWPDAHIERNSM